MKKQAEIKTKKNIKAFTLIELLIVIAIIGILASLVLVSLNMARRRSEMAGALSEFTQIEKIVEMCILDGGALQVAADLNNGGGNICSLGASYGIWPAPRSGWQWNSGVWNTPVADEYMFLAIRLDTYVAPNLGDGTTYCGHRRQWAGALDPGIKRIGTGWTCTMYVGGVWK